MIEFICDIWYNPNIITSDVIIKSFQCTGIIYSPNQDANIFTAWSKTNEETGLTPDDLGEDYGEDDEKKGQNESFCQSMAHWGICKSKKGSVYCEPKKRAPP